MNTGDEPEPDGGNRPVKKQEIRASEGSVIKNVTQVFNEIVLGSLSELETHRIQKDLLHNIRRNWIDGYLKDSLANMGWIELDMEDCPDAVTHPQDAMLPVTARSRCLLEAGTTIDQVFEGANGSLLILGDPGSGKTTALLTLASTMADAVLKDPRERIPVVLHLSFWQNKRADLKSWLVEELRARYSLRADLAQAWLKRGQFIFLLDGLNEIRPEYQAACIRALNLFWNTYGLTAPVVVCCRTEEYRLLPEKLAFGRAVYLHRPSLQQVRESLADAGPQQQSIARLLDEDPCLQELACSPLMLRIMVSVYSSDAQPGTDGGTLRARRKRLLDTYVKKMFEQNVSLPDTRDSEARRAERKARVEHLLHWLASEMDRHHQSIFYIEAIQSDWLPTRLHRLFYSAGVRLIIGALICLATILAFMMVQSSDNALLFGLTTGAGVVIASLFALRVPRLPAILLASVLVGVLVHLQTGDIDRAIAIGAMVGVQCGLAGAAIEHFTIAEKRVWSWRKAALGLLALIAFITVYIVVYQARNSPIASFTDFFINHILPIIDFGMACLLAWSWKTSRQIDSSSIPNQGFWRSINNATRVGIIGILFMVIHVFIIAIAGVSAGARISLENPSMMKYLMTGPAVFLLTALPVSMAVGGAACIRHLMLRAILAVSVPVPWKLAQLLDDAAGRSFLQKAGGGYLFMHRLLLEYFLD